MIRSNGQNSTRRKSLSNLSYYWLGMFENEERPYRFKSLYLKTHVISLG